MRSVVLTGHGGPECLEWREDLPHPVAAEGEVLIRVAAAGVNNTDINTRVGWYSKGDGDADDASWAGAPLRFPRIQGIDVCGHIVTASDGVERCLIQAGAIKPVVAATFPLKQINAAQAAFADKAYTGKIVLSVSDDEGS